MKFVPGLFNVHLYIHAMFTFKWFSGFQELEIITFKTYKYIYYFDDLTKSLMYCRGKIIFFA